MECKHDFKEYDQTIEDLITEVSLVKFNEKSFIMLFRGARASFVYFRCCKCYVEHCTENIFPHPDPSIFLKFICFS